jgi:DNA-damage-inducible protein D
MAKDNSLDLNKDLESIKQVDENGVEFWMGRDLMFVLGYSEWRNFEEVLGKAAKAAINSGQDVDNHFVRVNKMVPIGSNTVRQIKDWKLDRYACYLIAQNGDPKKQEIAQAQTYFAIQTRRQELFTNLSEDQKRVFIRSEVTAQNKKLFKTAKQSGVSHFGLFNDAGYRGLYGLSLSEIEIKKGIKKGELLDRAGATELAANLFRITQTDEKLQKSGIKIEKDANQTHFMVGGKVRQTIKDIGGVLPEQLEPEKHIKEIKKEIKKIAKLENKKLKTSRIK